MSARGPACSAWFVIVAYFAILSPLFAGDYQPDIKGKSNEGTLAMEGFKYPSDMQVELWASEPMLANPVAFGIDEQGRLYICETFRQQKGVEDNRSHMDWLEADLSLTTVEQRRQMFEKFLGEGVEAYAKEQDRIRLLEDTDGDGHADKATIFADGFNDVLDGTGAGVLAIDGHVFYTCIPDLYKLTDTDGDGVADEQESLHHGYGVRVAFRGHDMHGLVVGPDGRLYFSIGDRGYNVRTKEGQQLTRPDTGAVFRCELDGSNLEVFAYGLRNPQELAFDHYGNLFTGDNNSDSGDQARWVYVTEGSDTGWRMYYQYLPDRGPWNRERIWYPYRADDQTTEVQPAYIVPPIANIADGPSGLVHNPGVGLPPQYDGHFLLADFRGSAGRSGIRHFGVKPKGASFELVDDGWLIESILATDVDFGYDGRLYLTDWVDGWNGPGKGRVYTFTNSHYQYPSDAAHSDQLMKQDWAKLKNQQLVNLLDHPDYRIRQKSQFQLVKNKATDELLKVARKKDEQLSRLHAIWGMGQLIRHGEASADPLISLAEDETAMVREQALNVLADAEIEGAFDAFVEAVKNGSPREQYFAAIGLGKLEESAARPALIELIKTNNNEDPALRHAAIMGLTGTATAEELATLANVSTAEPVRLAAVVALRRQESPQLAAFLNDPSPKIVVEAARAIHDLGIEEAMPALAALPLTSDSPDALLRRVMNANFRIGGSENAQRVATMAAEKKFADGLRSEAIEQLLNWDAPPVLDRVTNLYRPLAAREKDLASSAVRKHLGGMMNGGPELKTKAIKLAGKYEVQNIASYLKETFDDANSSQEMRVESLAALNAVNADGLDRLLETATSDESDEVRAMARKLLACRSPEKAIPKLADALQSGTPVERQSAVNVLGTINRPAADKILLGALDQYLAGTVAPEIQLDLIEVAKSRDHGEFKQRLEAIEAQRDPTDPLSAYAECLQGGNVARGYDVFFGNAAASCRRCHKVNGNGSDVGPDLSAVAKENPRTYLLESIVNPNAKIAKGFETVVFALVDGRVVSGIIKEETDTAYRLMKPQGEIVVVPKEDVDAQAKGQSGMPADMAKQLSKSEIRDLVEYLSTLKTPYKAEGHE